MPIEGVAAWVACCVAAALIGMAKGGFAGIGTLATPLVALFLPPLVAIGLLLPVFILQDLVSVWIFRKDWNRWIIAWMMPGAIVGFCLGWLFASITNSSGLGAAVGRLTIIFAVHRLWIERGNRLAAPANSPGWMGILFGAASGFTSQVAHSGAPPFQMWVAPRKLPQSTYVGTNAVLFAAINWLKVPTYISLGALTLDVLSTSLALAPIAMGATLISLKLVKRLEVERFYKLSYWLMLVLGFFLVIRSM